MCISLFFMRLFSLWCIPGNFSDKYLKIQCLSKPAESIVGNPSHYSYDFAIFKLGTATSNLTIGKHKEGNQ